MCGHFRRRFIVDQQALENRPACLELPWDQELTVLGSTNPYFRRAIPDELRFPFNGTEKPN